MAKIHPIGSRYHKLVVRNTKHGCSKRDTTTPEYVTWQAMITRCTNKRQQSYKNYGGRGITICERWRTSFEDFLTDMGPKPSPKHSLDRIDNNGNYEPGNCRWATMSEQRKNSRTTHLITHDGVTMCLNDWAKKLGITHAALIGRIKSGWPMGKALTTQKLH